MFDIMMHLRNFRQVFIKEVRQVMTRSPVKNPVLLDRNSEGHLLKIGDIGVTVRTPCEKFLYTPLDTSSAKQFSFQTHALVCNKYIPVTDVEYCSLPYNHHSE